ncbi:hypothetical protein [Treponema denticola]|uniref:hypothetical protein n=1 Tax=Treponema denticola TaxID=158 RepID=UPI0020A3313B|nr:hypothetical protein [Treponema denticola]UTC87544.1 hypothetical protein E4N79_05080 [Treponema denticola]UTC95096.1 hypothetical protein E4N85_04850 [Treponema denticola]
MKKLSFTVAAAAVVVGMVLLCTACQFDGQKIVDQFLLGSYGTYEWVGDDLTIKSNEENFQKHFAGLGKNSVTLKKETVGTVDYLTSPEYNLDAKNMGGDVWQGIFYLKGMGFRTIKITLKSGGRCEIQPGLSVEEGIKFPEDLTITGSLELNAGKILPKEDNPSTTGMPTYTKQFFASVKSGSLKTKWVGDNEVETFADHDKVKKDMMVTETWKGSSQLFKTKADKVYYKKVYKVDGSGNFVLSSDNTFEIFIPKGTALPAVFP